MNMRQQAQKGFTLIELMIVIAIIGILSAVALPAYQNYTEKSRFTEVVLGVGSVRSSIDVCYQTRGEADLGNCDTYAKIGTTADAVQRGDEVTSVVITPATAVVTGTGANGSTYILTPTASDGGLTWASTGTCIANGHC